MAKRTTRKVSRKRTSNQGSENNGQWLKWHEITMVSPLILNVDSEYQRFVIDSIVKDIAKNFDPNAFGVVTVGRRSDGTMWVTDGQQRMTASLQLLKDGRLPGNEIPCVIFESAGRSHEATLFMMQDNRRNISSLSKWKAARAAGERSVLAIDNLLEKHGFSITVPISNRTHAVWPNFTCVSRIRSCYKSNMEALERSLSIIMDAWGYLESKHAVQEVTLFGIWTVCNAMLNSPDPDFDRLTDILKKTKPEVILKSFPTTDNECRWQSGYARGDCYAVKVFERYNNRLHKARKIDFKSMLDE